MLQQILAYGLLLFAVYFLIKKYVLNPKKKKPDCGKDCNC